MLNMLRAYIAVTDNKVLITYANNNNSFYGTTTILEVFGNQIAGSFLNNSKDAIALESGKGGDIIKLGFGGYCQCEGVTEGQTIDSNGVTAYSPLDEWLYIKQEMLREYVVGEYLGSDTNHSVPAIFDLGFMPSAISVYGVGNTTEIYSAPMVVTKSMKQGDSHYYVEIESGTIKISSCYALAGNNIQLSTYLNKSGITYRYIAWR